LETIIIGGLSASHLPSVFGIDHPTISCVSSNEQTFDILDLKPDKRYYEPFLKIKNGMISVLTSLS